MSAVWRALSHIALTQQHESDMTISIMYHRRDGEWDVMSYYCDHPDFMEW